MTQQAIPTRSAPQELASHQQAWEMVLGALRQDMTRADFETWVQPLRVISLEKDVLTVGAYNSFGRDWVEARLTGRITHLLEGMYRRPITLRVSVVNEFYNPGSGAATTRGFESHPSPAEPPEAGDETAQPAAQGAGKKAPARGEPSARKMMLQRAYGSERARLIQPERGMFVTLYFFERWLPLVGHSAFTVILAARTMCYWNPLTGELRNQVETDMAELAHRAAVSVRTVKDVLANPLIAEYFLRYRVRRMMTPNGVRTAGILLVVRMDDPLTPEDQAANNLDESGKWYPAEFGPGEDEEDPL